VITLAGVEHCFMYVVQNDVVRPTISSRSSTRVGKTCMKRSPRCRVRITSEPDERVSRGSGSAGANNGYEYGPEPGRRECRGR
jgi:hypothetical protein